MLKKYLYVLALTDNCYYIGVTDNLKNRFFQHKSGGAGWTSLHKPLNIVEYAENVFPCVENKVTLNYIDQFGWEKVRGGSFLSIDIRNPAKRIAALRKKYAMIIDPELVPGTPSKINIKKIITNPEDYITNDESRAIEMYLSGQIDTFDPELYKKCV